VMICLRRLMLSDSNCASSASSTAQPLSRPPTLSIFLPVGLTGERHGKRVSGARTPHLAFLLGRGILVGGGLPRLARRRASKLLSSTDVGWHMEEDMSSCRNRASRMALTAPLRRTARRLARQASVGTTLGCSSRATAATPWVPRVEGLALLTPRDTAGCWLRPPTLPSS